MDNRKEIIESNEQIPNQFMASGSLELLSFSLLIDKKIEWMSIESIDSGMNKKVIWRGLTLQVTDMSA